MSNSRRLTLVAFTMLTLAGCSSSDATPNEDAGADVATDSPGDSSASDADSAPGVDSGSDATAEASAGSDGGNDAMTDAAADGGADATADTGSDAAADTGSDAAADATADTGSDAATDAADSSTCPVYVDGTYDWGVWTCGSGGNTTDIRAFAVSVGIASVDEVIVGDAGTINSNFAGSPACSRMTEFAISYPSCGTVTSTTSSSYTCSATCDPAKCTAGTQPVVIGDYSFSVVGDTHTQTRLLDAAFFSSFSLQQAAGCHAGDTEISTLIKR
jgi:hypothetical protein